VKVVVFSSNQHIAPWGDPVAEVQVLGRSLQALMAEEYARIGLELASEPPAGAPYLLVSDRTWITSAALQAYLAVAQPGQRLKVDNALWLEMTAPLQECSEVGVFEVELKGAGEAPVFSSDQTVTVDLNFEEREAPKEHPALAHAMPERIPFSDACVHQVDHWSHVLRINWMAISSTFAREGRRFKRKNPVVKFFGLLWIFLKTRSFSKWKYARALSQVAKTASIHPTAVVELSVIGEGAEIGPHAVVRGSVVGAGVKIEEHAIVNASVLGDNARIGKRGTANLSVLYPEAFIGAGPGHQASVFGRSCFLAWSVTTYDLSFGDPVKVLQKGERVSSGTHFLGCAVGHRARIGGHVKLGYGVEVPNDAMVVGDSSEVLRSWKPGSGPHRVVEGVAKPTKNEP
jgi:carbonic anhydrase/acetyltransferase-like protein (isoleucine patch superfamily)